MQDRVFALESRHISWAAAGIMLASLMPQFFYFSPDDICFAVMPDPNRAIGQVYMSGGRYLSALLFEALRVCHLNAMRDYPVLAALYAIAFGYFAKSAASFVWPENRSPVVPVMGAALFCFHGFQLDLNSFKLQYGVSALMYALMAAYLAVMSRAGYPRRKYAYGLALLVLLNFTYQPATMALAWLTLARALVELAGCRETGASYRARVRGVFARLTLAATIVVTAAGLYIVASGLLSRAVGIPLVKTYAQFSWPVFRGHFAQHLSAIGELLRPAPDGLQYGLLNGGVLPVLWAALALACIYALSRLAGTLAAAVVAAVVVLLLVFAQNPQNLAVAYYWPSPRSSFYASLITPVLAAAAAAAAAAASAGRRRVIVVVGIALLLEIAVMARLMADRYELFRRDLVVAAQINAQIAVDPRLSGAKGIRFPAALGQPYTRFYAGLPFSGFGAGGSLFASPWARSALLQYAGGADLLFTGDATCQADEPRHLRPMSLRREGDDIVVCF